ncbi:UNVERIFIED_CONTAM: hypothetical protein K2H54_041693 [Gekko kuhli]
MNVRGVGIPKPLCMKGTNFAIPGILVVITSALDMDSCWKIFSAASFEDKWARIMLLYVILKQIIVRTEIIFSYYLQLFHTLEFLCYQKQHCFIPTTIILM